MLVFYWLSTGDRPKERVFGTVIRETIALTWTLRKVAPVEEACGTREAWEGITAAGKVGPRYARNPEQR